MPTNTSRPTRDNLRSTAMWARCKFGSARSRSAFISSRCAVTSARATGIERVPHASGFVLLGANWRAARAAQFFDETNGPNNTAFQGGTLCVRSPVVRLPAATSSAQGAAPCDGGTHVRAQLWSRDDARLRGFEVSLTDALEFAIDL